MLHIPVENCCGCTACCNICPTSAIRMEPDCEGFLQPIIDTALCCNCRKCEIACPITNPPTLPDSFEGCVIAQSRDPQVLDESTSGGFVDALCRCVTDKMGGYVCGVAFNSEFLPHHKIVGSYEDAKAFRNSKYAQSDLGTAFKDIHSLLRNGSTVMFIGTPCQVAGLKSFVGERHENLITVDLVCRSIPSPKLWRMYLDWQENRFGAKIVKVFCRKKTYGYHSGALEIDFENGKHYAGSNRVDYYMKSFHMDICSRRSCYDCKFKTKHRCSDFTVFDSWRPDVCSNIPLNDNNKGYSGVIIHTKKGKELADTLTDVVMYEASLDKLLENTGGMAIKSIERSSCRDDFYGSIEYYGFHETVKKISKVSFLDRLIEFAKPLFYRVKQYFNR